LYSLSLHDALPIWGVVHVVDGRRDEEAVGHEAQPTGACSRRPSRMQPGALTPGRRVLVGARSDGGVGEDDDAAAGDGDRAGDGLALGEGTGGVEDRAPGAAPLL